MLKNPQRVAWTILILSFGTFLALAISIPLGIRWYLINATTVHTTQVTSVRGTILAKQPNDNVPIPITDGSTIEVNEQAEIITDNASQAVIGFFDDSSLTLYNDASVTIEWARSPRFQLSNRSNRIVLFIRSGRVRVIPAASNPELEFEIRTPQALATFERGNYSVEVSTTESRFVTRSGKAWLNAKNQIVTLSDDQRTTVLMGKPPSAPQRAEQNFVVNGDFSKPITDHWSINRYIPPGINTVTSTVQINSFGQREVAEFRSEGADGIHTEVGILQRVNKDVRDYRSLKIHANVRLVRQSLPGGGQLGSEFPLMIHISYKDAEGNDRDWYHGFYIIPPPGNFILPNLPENSGERIPRFLWYPFESDNLLEEVDAVKPVYIKFVRIYASGHLYNSMVTDVELLAQE